MNSRGYGQFCLAMAANARIEAMKVANDVDHQAGRTASHTPHAFFCEADLMETCGHEIMANGWQT